MLSSNLRKVIQRDFKRNLSNYIVAGDEAVVNKLKSDDSKKIFYFTASWCPPCKKIAPVFERLSKEHESLMFVKIDVDTNPIVSQEYKVQSIPTFYFLNGKRVVTEFTGAAEESLIKGIKELEESS